jgi:phage terminase large subunit GpA-like protein
MSLSKGHISTEEAQAELRRLIGRAWPSEIGPGRHIDLVAIDGGAWQSDVFGFVSGFPKSKVIMTRGVSGDDKPPYASVLRERRRDGTLVKYRGRFFNIGVNGLKDSRYKALRITDSNQRGFVDFPQGLEDNSSNN